MKPFPPQAFAWRFMIEGYYDMGWRWVGAPRPFCQSGAPTHPLRRFCGADRKKAAISKWIGCFFYFCLSHQQRRPFPTDFIQIPTKWFSIKSLSSIRKPLLSVFIFMTSHKPMRVPRPGHSSGCGHSNRYQFYCL